MPASDCCQLLLKTSHVEGFPGEGIERKQSAEEANCRLKYGQGARCLAHVEVLLDVITRLETG